MGNPTGAWGVPRSLTQLTCVAERAALPHHQSSCFLEARMPPFHTPERCNQPVTANQVTKGSECEDCLRANIDLLVELSQRLAWTNARISRLAFVTYNGGRHATQKPHPGLLSQFLVKAQALEPQIPQMKG